MPEIFNLHGLLTAKNFAAFIALTGLQTSIAMLNLLYISVESRRVDTAKQRQIRQLGLGSLIVWIAVALFVAILTAEHNSPLYAVRAEALSITVTPFHALVLFGSVLSIWVVCREIYHLLLVDHLEYAEAAGGRTVQQAGGRILASTAKFAIVSVLIGLALSESVAVIILSIVGPVGATIWLSDHGTRLIERHRGLMVASLLVVFTASLTALGQATAGMGLKIFGADVTGMSRGAFYFSACLVGLITLGQHKYRRSLLGAREDAARIGVPTTEPASSSRAASQTDLAT